MEPKREPGYYWVKYKEQEGISEYMKMPNGSYAWSRFGRFEGMDFFDDGVIQVHGHRIEPPEVNKKMLFRDPKIPGAYKEYIVE